MYTLFASFKISYSIKIKAAGLLLNPVLCLINMLPHTCWKHSLVWIVCNAHVDRSLQAIVYTIILWIVAHWFESETLGSSRKLRNGTMKYFSLTNHYSLTILIIFHAAQYSTYDKVKHTIKLLLCVYKDQYMLSKRWA